MKTKEELNALKEKIENVSKKLAELSEEEAEQVAGGFKPIDINEHHKPLFESEDR